MKNHTKLVQAYKRLLLLGVFYLLLFTAKAQEISVSPAYINFEGKPGETVSQTVTLTNTGKKPYDFAINLKDWKRDSLGNKIYSEVGTLPHSNANQIRIIENTLTLMPGEKKTTTIYMEIPTQQTDRIALNSMLFFTQTNPDDMTTENASVGIKISYEFGIQLFYNPLGALRGDLAFESFDADLASETSSTPSMTVAYKNTGEVNKLGFLRMELTNKQTGEELKLDPIPFAIMPLSNQKIPVSLPPSLKAGDYLAVAILDAGTGYNLKVAEKNVRVQ